MIRSILLIGLGSVVFAQAPPPAQQGQLDSSPALFAVLTAINAAGYDADLDSHANSPLRRQVREIIAAKQIESLEELKKFFAAHRQSNWSTELNQYVSFALSVDGPPDFRWRMKPEELPLDVRPLEGLDQLMARFYAEAKLDDLWKQAQPAFDQVIAAYHSGVAKALLEANAYVRSPTSGFRGRRFQIYVDLLAAPNQVQTRSYKDDYFVVVTPAPEPQLGQIRHAYLHYLLDPLALRHFEQLNRLKGLADFAAPAPALETAYKDDFVLLATECIIKAAESRLAPASQRQALVDQALREGWVLTPAFTDGLAVYEKQEQSLRLYYPDLIGQIDLAREDKRLEKVRFAGAAPVKKAPPAPPPPPPVLSGTAKTLAEAEDLYARRQLEQARQSYLKVLESPGETALHARAYYGLARIAALQKDPELAEKLFQKTLEIAPDKETESWTRLYLGRLADAAGDRSEAEKNYRAVLAIDGAPATVRNAAAKELAQPARRNQ